MPASNGRGTAKGLSQPKQYHHAVFVRRTHCARVFHPSRKKAGHQINLVQKGLDPDDWKPFDVVGSGTKEIRIILDDGWFRVMYVAKFADENPVHKRIPGFDILLAITHSGICIFIGSSSAKQYKYDNTRCKS